MFQKYKINCLVAFDPCLFICNPTAINCMIRSSIPTVLELLSLFEAKIVLVFQMKSFVRDVNRTVGVAAMLCNNGFTVVETIGFRLV